MKKKAGDLSWFWQFGVHDFLILFLIVLENKNKMQK